MPGGDRTGPQGFGPRTGRAAGFCAGYNRPGFANWGFGRGMGFGRGSGHGGGRGGRGWRNRYYATSLPGWAREWDYPYDTPEDYSEYPGRRATRVSEKDELADLKRQAGNLTEALSEVNNRIKQLESKQSR